MKRIQWPTKGTELPDRGGKMPDAAANSVNIVLDEKGKALSSTELAAKLGVWRDPRSLHRYQHVRPDAIPGRNASALLHANKKVGT